MENKTQLKSVPADTTKRKYTKTNNNSISKTCTTIACDSDGLPNASCVISDPANANCQDLSKDFEQKLVVNDSKHVNGVINGGSYADADESEAQMAQSCKNTRIKKTQHNCELKQYEIKLQTVATDCSKSATTSAEQPQLDDKSVSSRKQNSCSNAQTSSSCVNLSPKIRKTKNSSNETTSLCNNRKLLDSNENKIDVTSSAATISTCERANGDCDPPEATTDPTNTSNQLDSLTTCNSTTHIPGDVIGQIAFVQYESELQMPLIMNIIQKKLSEPYSIYTYRYFIHNWPQLCFLAMYEEKCVGAIVCKLDVHRKTTYRGYIAMLAVDENFRKRSIGSTLVKKAIKEMWTGGADEVVLETEVTNKPALRLYEALGFVRDKRLFRYYLNGVDALRLKLWLK